MDYKFKNSHIGTAFKMISAINVSGDAVDVFSAIRHQLVAADKEFPEQAEKAEEVSKDGNS